MHTLKDMVKDNKKVHFSFYRDRQLFYRTECGFEFPVPIDDIGNATFLAEDKAILFMSYFAGISKLSRRLDPNKSKVIG